MAPAKSSGGNIAPEEANVKAPAKDLKKKDEKKDDDLVRFHLHLAVYCFIVGSLCGGDRCVINCIVMV